MKYETPQMEVLKLEETEVIMTSMGEGPEDIENW